MRYIFGPLIIVLGFLIIKYSFWITNQTGKLDFAERYLGFPFAGTYSWWKLVGLIFIILAVLWIAGFLDFGSTGVTTTG